MRKTVKRAAFGVPVLLAAWGVFALVNAGEAGASPMPGTAESLGSKLVFQAGDGTVNKVTVTRNASTGALLLTDAGNTYTFLPLSDGNCTRVDSDTLQCAAGVTNIEVWLGDGNDSFHTGLAGIHTTVHGSDGDDVIQGGNGGGSLYGEAGKDQIYAGDIRDYAYGGAGDDKIIGGGGNDVIYGQAGKDELRGGDGDERIDGGADADQVYGDNGQDDLRSANDDDTVHGGPGDDTLGSGAHVFGEDGADRVVINTYWGDYWGGAGDDTVDYSLNSLVRVSLDGNTNDGGSGADCDDWIGCPVTAKHNVHGDFEHVIGTAGNDKISGNGEADDFDGKGGNDSLYGGGGNDYLDAGDGANQRTDGGAGWDTCVGYGVTARPGCEV